MHMLVWYEPDDGAGDPAGEDAQEVEACAWKVRLIEGENLEWRDLYPTIL